MSTWVPCFHPANWKSLELGMSIVSTPTEDKSQILVGFFVQWKVGLYSFTHIFLLVPLKVKSFVPNPASEYIIFIFSPPDNKDEKSGVLWCVTSFWWKLPLKSWNKYVNQNALRRRLEYLSLRFEEMSAALQQVVQCSACHQLVERDSYHLIMRCPRLHCFGNVLVFSSTSWRCYNTYCKAGVTKYLAGTKKNPEHDWKRAKYLSAGKQNICCVWALWVWVWWQLNCSSISCVAPMPPIRLLLPQLALC